MAGLLYIGTSGWSYSHWKHDFYKAEPQRNWLDFYAQRLNSVEINGTFYRLQKAETFQHWYQVTPSDFRFSLKANRYLTHNKKLLDPEPSIAIEQERAQWLGDKLAVVLWQLPQNFKINIERLEAFIEALTKWANVRHVIEFRHPSWFDAEVEKIMCQYSIAICQSDSADWPMWDAVSTDLIYVRLHGHKETYVSSYTHASLVAWTEKIKQWQQRGKMVYVYFNNDAYAHAPRNAMQLYNMVE